MLSAKRRNTDFLRRWLSVNWGSPGATERAFYPDLTAFMSDLPRFPRNRIRPEPQRRRIGEFHTLSPLWRTGSWIEQGLGGWPTRRRPGGSTGPCGGAPGRPSPSPFLRFRVGPKPPGFPFQSGSI
jgi:hypothetical protein